MVVRIFYFFRFWGGNSSKEWNRFESSLISLFDFPFMNEPSRSVGEIEIDESEANYSNHNLSLDKSSPVLEEVKEQTHTKRRQSWYRCHEGSKFLSFIRIYKSQEYRQAECTHWVPWKSNQNEEIGERRYRSCRKSCCTRKHKKQKTEWINSKSTYKWLQKR